MDKDAKPLKDRVVVSGVVTGFGAWLLSLLALIFNWNKLPPQIPFFYSQPWGDSWLLDKNQLVWIMAGFAAVLIINLFLAKTTVRHQRLLGHYLVWGAAVIEIMLAIDLIKIIGLVL